MSSNDAASTSVNDASTGECRACLKQLDTENSYNLFQAWTSLWEGMNSTIAEDLSKLADVQLKETDKHSKLICSVCCTNLWNACKFKSLVQANDKILRQRYPETEVEKEWPQPIQVEKSITGVYDNTLQVEIKQEVLTDDENTGNGEEGYTSTNCLDIIKIEPEEIVEPVTRVPASFRVTELNGEECLEEEDDPPVDLETNQPIQDKATSSDPPKKNTEVGTKQKSPLTQTVVMEAVAEALSKPVEVCKSVEVATHDLNTGSDVNVPSILSSGTKNALSDNIPDNAGANKTKKVRNSYKISNDDVTKQKTTQESDSDDTDATDFVEHNTVHDEQEVTTSDIILNKDPSPDCNSDVEIVGVQTSPVKRETDKTMKKVDDPKSSVSSLYIEVPSASDPLKEGTKLGTLSSKQTETAQNNKNMEFISKPIDKNLKFLQNMAMPSVKDEYKDVLETLASQSEGTKTYIMQSNKDLTQKLDSLSQTVATVVESQKVMADTQEKILAHVMGLSSQFEQFIKNSKNEASADTRTNSLMTPFVETCPMYATSAVPSIRNQIFKPIDNAESFQALEESLKDETFEMELKSRFLFMLAASNPSGTNCYILLDLMFDRKFLTQCSWSGGSRDDSIKICFKVYKNVIHFFFSVIYCLDQTFTFVELEEFLKRILKNSLKRNAAKRMRASAMKRRRKRITNKSDSDNETQEIDENLFLKSLMSATNYETVRDVT